MHTELYHTTINVTDILTLTQKKLYASPGTCDQGVRYFLIESSISKKQLEDMRTRSQASVVPYETVLVPLEELELQTQDANAIVAARLYELYSRQREIARQRQIASDPSGFNLGSSTSSSPSSSPSLSPVSSPLFTSGPVPVLSLQGGQAVPLSALAVSSPAPLGSLRLSNDIPPAQQTSSPVSSPPVQEKSSSVQQKPVQDKKPSSN